MRLQRTREKGRQQKFGLTSTIQGLILIFGSIAFVVTLIRSYVGYKGRFGHEMTETSSLPDHPSTILGKVNNKDTWTIWIPSSHGFPLRPRQYEQLCSQANEIVSRQTKSMFASKAQYMDIGEASRTEMLRAGHLEPVSAQTCKSSLTYVMDTDDAGMGNTLLSLWLAYGIAVKEGRAFFVDDARWLVLILSHPFHTTNMYRAYGNYSSYFKAPPNPGCQPAPANYRVPCPKSASHLVVTTSLVHSLIPSHSSSQQDIFSLMRTGYESLFHLADHGDYEYLQTRKDSVFAEIHSRGGSTVGLHIRRGDMHPQEKMFEADYLPLTRYMDDAHTFLAHHNPVNRQHESALNTLLSPFTAKPDLKRDLARSIGASQLFVASDDPLVFETPELSGTMRAQERFHLATKADLEGTVDKSKAPSPLDTLHGWDGGFYRSVFLSLGRPDHRTILPPKHAILAGSSVESEEHRRIAKAAIDATTVVETSNNPWQASDSLEAPSNEALAMRTLIGRGYLLDLAVVGQCDAIICDVGSAACRVLGVMAGWEKVKQGQWRNIDGHVGWMGISSGQS
jgi:hypothetical protein